MHLPATIVALGSLASVAHAAAKPVVVLGRQTASETLPPALYQCHFDCGYAIEGAIGSSTYCSNITWLGLYDSCLYCANTEGIWNDYSPGIVPAAKYCGWTAVPSPSSSVPAVAARTPEPVVGRRQDDSGALYECHADCGYAIEDAIGGTAYCKNSTWVGLLDGCLNCANTYGIWNDYSPGVVPAAEVCGLTAVPSPSSAAAAAVTATAAPTTTAAAVVAAVSSSAAAPAAAATTSAAPAPAAASSSAASHAAASHSTAAASHSGAAAPSGKPAAAAAGNSTTGAVPTPVTPATAQTTAPVSGASQWRAGAFVAGAVALLAAGLM